MVLIVCTLSLAGRRLWNGLAFDASVSAAERAVIAIFHKYHPGELFNRAGMPKCGKSSHASDRENEPLPEGVIVDVWTKSESMQEAG